MIYFLSLVFLYIKFQNKWIYLFLLNMPLIDVFHNLIPGKQIGGGYLRIATLVIVYATFLINSKSERKKYSKRNYSFYFLNLLLLLLLFLSLPESTNYSATLPRLLDLVMVILTYKIYYYFFSISHEPYTDLRKLFNICLFSASAWLIYIITCTIFQYGRVSDIYSGQLIIYFGHSNFFGIYPWVYMLMIFPFVFYIKHYRRGFFSIVLFASILVLFFIGKRTYVYILGLSLAISLMFYFVKTLKIQLFILTIVVIVSVLMLFKNAINKHFFEVRATSLEQSYKEVGRFQELASFKFEIIDRKPLRNILFGIEIFNTKGAFFKYSTSDDLFFDKGRILHSDYADLLYGSGIIGLSIYVIFLISVGIYLHKNYKTKRNRINDQNKMIFAIFWGVFIAILFNGFSDGVLGGFSNRFIPFMILGAITGYFSNRKFVSNV